MFWAAISMILLGVLFGVGLALASKAFSVDTDPRLDEVYEALPQINCGACGYKGCMDYAEAVVKKEVGVDKCIPGGEESAEAIALVMGVTVESKKDRLVSFLHCQGTNDRCPDRFEYDGPMDCRAAVLTQNAAKACIYGCIGLGTCVSACPFDAIVMGPGGLPVVLTDKCTGCGVCVRVCPRGLFELLPESTKVYLACSSQAKGKAAKDACSVGCIACRKCVKVDPENAIEMKGNLPVLDYTKGSTFVEAATACPMNCFVVKEELAAACAQADTKESGAANVAGKANAS